VTKRTRHVIISSLVGVSQRSLQVVATLISMPMVLHALGTERFGIWGAAVSLAWMTGVVDLGLSGVVLSAIVREYALTNTDGARKELENALSLAILLCLLLSCGVALALPVLASPKTAPSYLIATILLAANIPVSLASSAWLGLQKGYVAWSWDGLQTSLTLGGLVALSLTKLDERFYVAVVFAAMLTANSCSLAHLMVKHPELRPRRLGVLSIDSLRGLLWRGLPFFLLGLTASLNLYADNIITLSTLGAKAAGHMTIIQRICQTVAGFLLVLTQPLWPAFADAATRKDIPWIKTHIWRSVLIVTSLAAGGATLLLAAGRMLLHLWLGPMLTFEAAILWSMAAWIIILALGIVPDFLLKSLGRMWLLIIVSILSAITAVSLKLILAPNWGLPGILLGTAFAYGLIQLPIYMIWLWRWLRSPT